MLTGFEAALATVLILFLEWCLYEGAKKIFSDPRPRCMTFWGNWAASFGTLMFAAINWIIFPDVLQNHHFISKVIFGVASVLITVNFYLDWKSKPRQNSGHIIGPAGEIELAGCLHAVYMTAQTYAVFMFFLTPFPWWKTGLVGVIFAAFIALQQHQAIEVQGAFKPRAKRTAIWQICVTAAVIVVKLIFF